MSHRTWAKFGLSLQLYRYRVVFCGPLKATSTVIFWVWIEENRNGTITFGWFFYKSSLANRVGVRMSLEHLLLKKKFTTENRATVSGWSFPETCWSDFLSRTGDFKLSERWSVLLQKFGLDFKRFFVDVKRFPYIDWRCWCIWYSWKWKGFTLAWLQEFRLKVSSIQTSFASRKSLRCISNLSKVDR